MMGRTCGRVTLAVIAGLMTTACAEDGGPSYFVSTLGQDTVTIESFTRTGNVIEGVLVERSPYTHVITYRAEIGEDGTIDRLEAETATPSENPDGPEGMRWVTTIADGTATVVAEGGRNPGTSSFEVGDDAIPTLGRASLALFAFEQATRQAHTAQEAEYPIELVFPTRPQPVDNTVTHVGGDTVSISFFGSPLLAWTDEGGDIRGTSGALTTMKAETVEVEPFDAGALASAWATADAAGTGLGVASPGATVSASVSGVNIEVVYSQPAKRGREIWGGLVPHEGVWRTGANAATVFTVGQDIMLGDLAVPAGSYTLWTTYSSESAELIINTQTGQWGTAHDAAMDMGSTALSSEPLDEVTERFTISIEESAEGGGMLYFAWDQTRFGVPIRVR